MMFQATVPNTYAAGLATKTIADRTKARSADKAPTNENLTTVCECGEPKVAGKTACARCFALETFPDHRALDESIFEACPTHDRVTIGELIEVFQWKHPRHVIQRALRRLITAGRLMRKPIKQQGEHFGYWRA